MLLLRASSIIYENREYFHCDCAYMLDDEGGKEGHFVVKLVFIRGCYLLHLESYAILDR